MIVEAVDAARWWGPAGWLYRNCAGNLAASAVWGPVGFGLGALWAHRKIVVPARTHRSETARLHAKVDAVLDHHGIEPPV
ncbi:hypothetical protein K6U06_06575 [Acidiferrimicrobium sp. IK]|uniref:hypothetical protein n=1 Tax=Acidiferrimicrobium sp. IK TaxID=2871700 RepID=UPI0021CB6E9E|nr:hypothetical protein [Acidiferrimicrobium sp. IK]MCU4184018.1 hypothetical protein [Acidiferrimicrobium sp. IK]